MSAGAVLSVGDVRRYAEAICDAPTVAAGLAAHLIASLCANRDAESVDVLMESATQKLFLTSRLYFVFENGSTYWAHGTF